MRRLRPYEHILDTNVLLRLVLPLCVGIALGEAGHAWLHPYVGSVEIYCG